MPLQSQKFGTAPFALSLLDNGLTSVGETAVQGHQKIIDVAKAADQHAYERLWFSEHHAMPASSDPFPPLTLARLVGETERIRLGAGGVMLPNHTPLVIAEIFGMLSAMAPGRIDLGLGRAPGTDGATAAALRRSHEANNDFPGQVHELLGFMHDSFPSGHRYVSVSAVPGPRQAELNRVAAPETAKSWILGSSNYSAHLAADLGLPYAFALQFGDADVESAFEIYRKNFKPSEHLDEPYTLVSAGAIAMENGEEAYRQALPSALAMLRMFKREDFLLFSPEEVMSYYETAPLQEKQIIASYAQRTMTGTGAEVAEQLEELHQRTGADELMMVLGGFTPEAHLQTVTELAKHYNA